MTIDEALQQGFDAFEAALGSTPTDTNVESGWKSLFRNKVGWNIDFVTSHVQYLEGLCTWMGNYALNVVRSTQNITLREVNMAFQAVQEYAYHQNGDSPTNLC